MFFASYLFPVCPIACAGHCEDCIEDFQCNTCEPRFRLEDEQPIKCEGKQLLIPHCNRFHNSHDVDNDNTMTPVITLPPGCYRGCNTCIDSAQSSCVDCLDGYYFVQTRDEPDTGRCPGM